MNGCKGRGGEVGREMAGFRKMKNDLTKFESVEEIDADWKGGRAGMEEVHKEYYTICSDSPVVL